MIRGPRRKTKLCLIAFCTITIIVCSQFGYIIIQKTNINHEPLPKPQVLKGDIRGKPFRTVHLDLKGAPPLLSYLRKILPILAAAGCDSLLIEYEDMFPYTGKLANLSAGNAYTRQQVKTLLSWAHDLNMEVIPLVQTFGHLEFALKLEEWRHLRELSAYPQELCPSNDGSMELIEEMLRQVMLMHKGVKYLHMGADEVFHLALCLQCSERDLTPREVYADFVAKVAEHIHSTYPGVQPIIWDDMIRKSPHLLGSTKLPQLVEPMIWSYVADVSQEISSHVIYWYSKFFNRIWIAGAFKGASQPTDQLPNLDLRFSNQISWMNSLKKFNIPKIVGYVLTGWSRFDHFAVLCELLPPSLPSLLLNLHLITLASDHKILEEQILFKKWKESLSCPNQYHFTSKSLKTDSQILNLCHFPGADLYEVILNLIKLENKIYKLDETLTKTKGWMTKYNINHNYTSTWYVEDYRNLYINKALKDLTIFSNLTKNTLHHYFDKYVVKEWFEQNIEPLFETLLYLDSKADKLIRRSVWPRRPIG